jgi:16S rRNA (guanine(966)-N(2))-methyltransferase RsmD
MIMRVITGTARGRRLKTLKGLSQRPTADRVRESVFSMLGGQVIEADVLDLFAGTGSLGIEALSRGARSALFVDTSLQAKAIIDENLSLTNLRDRAEIWVSDSCQAVKRLQRKGRRFHVIFADPPYGLGLGSRTLHCLGSCDVLNPGGIFILEHGPHEDLEGRAHSLEAVVEKTYGQTRVHVFQWICHKE